MQPNNKHWTASLVTAILCLAITAVPLPVGAAPETPTAVPEVVCILDPVDAAGVSPPATCITAAPDGAILVVPTSLNTPAVPSPCDLLGDAVGGSYGEVDGPGSPSCDALSDASLCLLSGLDDVCYGSGDSYTALGRSYSYQNFNPSGWGHKVSFWGTSGDCESASYTWNDLRTVPRSWSGSGHWDNVISSHKSYNDCVSSLYTDYFLGGSNDECHTESDCADLYHDNAASSIRFS